MADRKLQGWKEIATYLRLGVRTVQRWEHSGLPIHRVPGRGKGAVFAFCIELDKWMESSPMRTDAPTSGKGHFRYRILFVDDEQNIRRTGQAVLESQGYEVQVAEDGFDALNHLSRSLPDILITDLRMPNMSGFELLSVVRKRFPQIGVIAVSAEFVPVGSSGPLLADAFIPKGESPLDTFTKVANLLEQAPIRPAIRSSETAAVWIARSKSDYVVVTCPYCLRTSPAQQPVGDEAQRVTCPHCGKAVNFRMVPAGSPPRYKGPNSR